MKRIDDDRIELTQNEIDAIYDFIRDSLYREWDQYTDRVITSTPREEVMRNMNKDMYDFANNILKI